MLGDFGDSKYTTRDANYVFGLFSPYAFNMSAYPQMSKHQYNTLLLKDKFRSMEILKGRDGGVGKRIGLHFVGECGYFGELPLAKEFEKDNTLYDKYK